MDADVVRVAPVQDTARISLCVNCYTPGAGAAITHERYDTERKGFWLNTSLSRNLFNKSHDIPD